MHKIDLDGLSISPRVLPYVNSVLEVCIRGGEVNSRRTFEKAVCDRLKVGHALACNSGTNALHMALLALQIDPGREVITNPLTNIATIAAILKCGCVPVFPKVMPDGGLDMRDVKRKISARTAAILPVHFNGYGEDMNTLMTLARGHRIPVVEDACQAFGAAVRIGGRWQYLGTLGDIGVFSFGGGKVLNTLDGGMMVTGQRSLAERMNKLLGTGAYSAGEKTPGYNSRLDPLRAALGVINLQDFDQSLEARKKIWSVYKASLSGYSWLRVRVPKAGARPNYVVFSLEIKSSANRAALLRSLADIGYHLSLTRPVDQPNAYIKTCAFDAESLKMFDDFYERHVSLPTHGQITGDILRALLDRFRKVNEAVARARTS